MIISEINAGLGNSLFQYAFARALSEKTKQKLYFEVIPTGQAAYRLDKFNTLVEFADKDDIYRLKRRLKEPRLYRRIMRKLGFSIYCNEKYHFDNERIDSCDIETLKYYSDLYISGYFGDQKYFIEIEDIIRKEFALKKTLNSENEKVLSQIKNSNSVSIHMRHGDYVWNNFFAEIPFNYYNKAVDYIESHSKNSIYFIFSDDLNWVKNNLKLDVDLVFVDINDASTDYMELALMAACKHNIIANSTFSWWGGWLNENSEKIIIAPKIWYKNDAQKNLDRGTVLPFTWIKI